jgi:hypothetical protein
MIKKEPLALSLFLNFHFKENNAMIETSAFIYGTNININKKKIID